MPNADLIRAYEPAREAHREAVDALVLLLERMAVETIRDRWPDANEVELHGEYDADWIPRLRIQRVIALDGRALYDAAVAAEEDVENVIDEVGIEYLDLLLDLTGDDYLGAKSIEANFP
ncbi:MAG: hypothetical protein ACT4PW_04475 [Acidimicrobiia bacterium]